MYQRAKSRCRLAGGVCAWALSATIATAGVVTTELPPAIQADRLLVQAERQSQQGRVAEALASLDAARALREENGLETPEEFWYEYANVADTAGEHERAIEYATRYLGLAGREGKHYKAALQLLDAAEQAVEADRRREEAERLEREAEARRREYGQTLQRQVEQRELQVYTTLRKRLREERRHFPTAFADQLKSGDKGPEMVRIPGGRFQMGCKNRRDPPTRHQGLRKCLAGYRRRVSEGYSMPLHYVTIASFALARHEVTVAEWNACVDAGGCGDRGQGRWAYQIEGLQGVWSVQEVIDLRLAPVGAVRYGSGGADSVEVTWDSAQQFVRWLASETGKDYRLPSEAEMEYAARAGTRTRFSYGAEHQYRCTDAVAEYPANPFGLYGMHSCGYNAQWTQDCWNRNYNGAPQDGSAWLRGDCTQRVIRGYFRSMSRSGEPKDNLYRIRVARSAVQ